MALPRTTIAMGLVVVATVGYAVRDELRMRADERWFPPQEAVPPTPERQPTVDERVDAAIGELRRGLHDGHPTIDFSEDELDDLATTTRATVDWMPESDNTGLVLSFTDSDISERLCTKLLPLLREKWGDPIEYGSGSEMSYSWTEPDKLATATFRKGGLACQLRLMTWVPIETWLAATLESIVPVTYVGKPVATLRELLETRDTELVLDTDAELRWRVLPTLTMYYVPTVSAYVENGKVARLDVTFTGPQMTAEELRTIAAKLPITTSVEQSNYDLLTYDLRIGTVSTLQGKTP